MKNGEAPVVPSIKRRKRWKLILFCILTVLVALVLYRALGFSTKKSERRVARAEIPVQITPVVSKNLVYSLKATGDISPLMQVDLFPKVSGYLSGSM